jgi:hypothetical protein
LVVAGCVVAILAFDAISAALVRGSSSFRYGRLWPLQFGCYVVFGFVAMYVLLDIRLAGIAGAIAGLADGTIGWAITWRMGPNRRPDATRGSIVVAALSMVAFGFGLALIGALLFNVAVRVVLHAP